MKYTFLLATILSGSIGNAESCHDWFNRLQIKNNCEVNCAIAEVNMSTYTCPILCEELCKNTNKIENKDVDDLGFYGLTESEINFCKQNRVTCMKAYVESFKAEKYCLEIYPQSGVNDESDACRHFVWAILLDKNIGTDNAESILNAHENNPMEPEDQKAMDLANNRLGQLSSRKIKSIDSKEILKEFKTNLKQNRLIILEPMYKKSGGLP